MRAVSAFGRNLSVAAFVAAAACGGAAPRAPAAVERPSILFVTLDTTRADAIGRGRPGDAGAFDALEARGRRFAQAYATVPETLPSHTSMMTGLYPGGHGVHENARYVPATVPLARRATAARRLSDRGVRLGLRAEPALRAGARLRCLRRPLRARAQRT